MTALVNLIGPIKNVSAITSRAREERLATSKERYGERLPVEVDTHASGTVEFANGALVTAVFSFDVQNHGHSPIELYGLEGSIKVPDPNNFSGPVTTFRSKEEELGWIDVALTRPYTTNMRSIGAADMAQAILDERPHRASGELAYHVLEVIHAFDKSSKSGSTVPIESSPERPAPLPPGLSEGELD